MLLIVTLEFSSRESSCVPLKKLENELSLETLHCSPQFFPPRIHAWKHKAPSPFSAANYHFFSSGKLSRKWVSAKRLTIRHMSHESPAVLSLFPNAFLFTLYGTWTVQPGLRLSKISSVRTGQRRGGWGREGAERGCLWKEKKKKKCLANAFGSVSIRM